MKKARLILSVIALFSIIGGTTAFKAKKHSIQGIYICPAAGALPTTYITGYTLSGFGPTVTYATLIYTTCYATFIIRGL